eukprot:6996386-Pyramimonas_sp.AAC.1
MLSCYNPDAERVGYLHISIPKSTLILGMHTTEKIFHASSSVARLPDVRTTFDGCTYENNQW